MFYQPIDEMSLRHLFSSSQCESILKMEYIGPILNSSGSQESSPDCFVLDMRFTAWKVQRCEFKFIPASKRDFEQNGKFDIAIIWALPLNIRKEQLLQELLQQNGCNEVIILSEFKVLSDLPRYKIPHINDFYKIDEMKNILLALNPPTVYSAYIAASIFPKGFHMDHMVRVLTSKFPMVTRMHPRARAQIVGALLQTKIPMIVKMYLKIYRWNDLLNPTISKKIISDIIINADKEIPDTDTIKKFKNADLDRITE